MSKIRKNLNLYVIKYLLKISKLVNRNKLCTKEGFCTLQNVKNNLNCKKINIQLYENDDKDELLKILEVLKNNGKEIELIEFSKILENEDIEKLQQIDPNIIVNFRYMIDSYFYSNNITVKYDVECYRKILDKIEYLSRITKTNFNRTRRTSNVCC